MSDWTFGEGAHADICDLCEVLGTTNDRAEERFQRSGHMLWVRMRTWSYMMAVRHWCSFTWTGSVYVSFHTGVLPVLEVGLQHTMQT